MSHRQVLQWGIAITLVMFFLSGCAGASPTPIVIAPAPTSTPVPPIPTAALPVATDIPPTEIPPTAATELTATDLTTTAEGTATLGTVPATENPTDQPFLMKIDKFSVIVGRGILLEGRVVHGTLRGNDSVEILGPQNKVLSSSVLAVLISNTARDQVTVGDYAGILVPAIQPSELSPGMVLAAAGAFTSYEDALQELQ
jgi:translation elongation factor EF-Tu-like GTPase